MIHFFVSFTQSRWQVCAKTILHPAKWTWEWYENHIYFRGEVAKRLALDFLLNKAKLTRVGARNIANVTFTTAKTNRKKLLSFTHLRENSIQVLFIQEKEKAFYYHVVLCFVFCFTNVSNEAGPPRRYRALVALFSNLALLFWYLCTCFVIQCTSCVARVQHLLAWLHICTENTKKIFWAYGNSIRTASPDRL